MDWSTIVIIVVVAAILLFLWPRVSGRQRGAPSNLNPPANQPGQGAGVFPNDRDARTEATPQTERPHGRAMPTTTDDDDGDMVDETIKDVQSQDPRKSI